MKYFERLVFRCHACKKKLEWGESICPNCHTSVYKGFPIWIDKPLGLVIYILIVVILFIFISIINASVLNHSLPLAAVAAIAIVLGSIKFKIRPGMGLNPKHVHVLLDVSNIRTDAYWDVKRQFNYCPEKWEKDRIPYNSIYHLLQDGLSSQEGAEILAYFPEDESVDQIESIMQNTNNDETMMLAARSLVRIGNQKAKAVLSQSNLDKIMEMILEDDKIFTKEDVDRFDASLNQDPGNEDKKETQKSD